MPQRPWHTPLRSPISKRLRSKAAARVLVGLQQRELAKLANLDVTTINRMEASATDPVKALGVNIQKVLDALERKGVEITEDGVRLIPPRRR